MPMSSTTGRIISCDHCGKKYLWKPESAGKHVRCKCGQILAVPAAAVAHPVNASSLNAHPDAPAAVGDSIYDLATDPTPAPVRAPVAQPVAPAPITGLEDDLYRCPSCNQGMAPGAIICSYCGFNLKTGEKPVAKAAAHPPSPAAAFDGLTRRTAPIEEADRRGQLLKLLLPLGAIVLVLVVIAVYKLLAPANPAPAKPVNIDDAEVARLTEEDGATEIHQWYQENPERIAGPMNRTQALARADQLQKMGAKKVLAFGSAMTRSLAVELPDDPEQRKKLFIWENQFAKDHRYKGAVDQGQKYLLLNLGL